MIKKAIIIGMFSIIAILLMFGGKIVTVGYVESNDRDVDSFSETSLWMGVVAGILMMVVAILMVHIHILAVIIPFGVGASVLFICGYLLWCKSLAL